MTATDLIYHNGASTLIKSGDRGDTDSLNPRLDSLIGIMNSNFLKTWLIFESNISITCICCTSTYTKLQQKVSVVSKKCNLLNKT